MQHYPPMHCCIPLLLSVCAAMMQITSNLQTMISMVNWMPYQRIQLRRTWRHLRLSMPKTNRPWASTSPLII
jgi:hypothetical protein